MMWRSLIALGLTLLLLAPSTYADILPIPPFKAIYEISKSGMTIGKAERRLYQKDGMWQFESISRTTGFAAFFIKDVVLERSSTLYEKGKLIPQSYLYQREGGKREKEVHIKFDWQQQRVINSINQDPWVMEIPEGTMDKFLYQLQMMLDLPNQQQPLHYQIADGGKLKEYDIEIIGEERLETPIGDYQTLVLQRTDDERSTTMWCAEALHYLPLKITHQKKGESQFSADISLLHGIERKK